MIMMGDGPTVASENLTAPVQEVTDEEWSTDEEGYDPSMLIIKLAVPLRAIHALVNFKDDK